MTDSQRIFGDLTSWHWWLMVVVAGLLINIASSYLKTPIDRLVSRYSEKRRARTLSKEEALQRHAQKLALNPGLLALEIRNESVNLLLAIFFLAIAAVFASISSWLASPASAINPSTKFPVIAMALGAFILLGAALQFFSRATRHSERIARVRRHLQKPGDA